MSILVRNFLRIFTGATLGFEQVVELRANHDSAAFLQGMCEFFLYITAPGRSPNATAVQRTNWQFAGQSYATAALGMREAEFQPLLLSHFKRVPGVGQVMVHLLVDLEATRTPPQVARGAYGPTRPWLVPRWVECQRRAHVEWEREQPVAAAAYKAARKAEIASYVAQTMLANPNIPADAVEEDAEQMWVEGGAFTWLKNWALTWADVVGEAGTEAVAAEWAAIHATVAATTAANTAMATAAAAALAAMQQGQDSSSSTSSGSDD
jgi:hypothetical protein